MTDELFRSIFTVLTAIVGVALLAVLVSRNAQTPKVLQAAGGAFANALGAATGPVTNSGGLSSFGGFSGGASYPMMSY